jgi:tetratricopeptide (TPR) repeat protein
MGLCDRLFRQQHGTELRVNQGAPNGLSLTAPRKIFISYGRADAKELALRLYKDLRDAGHVPWLDELDIIAGIPWEEQIEDAILSHEKFVSLLTPHAVRRPDGVCLDEISLARYQKRVIVPAMVIQCRPPLGVYRLDWVDFQDWQYPARYEQSLRRLFDAITDGPKAEEFHARIYSTLKPLDFGAEVFRLNRDFTGRTWLFDELKQWLGKEESRVFFITGNPGSGKSAVMARLVHENPHVIAYHFCAKHLKDSQAPSRFVRSVSAQLAAQLMGYREALKEVSLEEAKKWGADVAFRRLVTDPLKAEITDKPLLIIVDALDEAFSGTGRDITTLLLDGLKDLPPWVRFVLTSRKQPEILDLFSEFRPHEIDAYQQENSLDVAAYIGKKLKEPLMADLLAELGVPAETIADLIALKSEGNFLYVTRALEAVRAGDLDPGHPDVFPEGLVGFYASFFARTFPSSAKYESFRPILDVISAAREPLTGVQIGRCLICDSRKVELDLESVASFFPDQDGKYQAYHKSLTDWLCGAAGKSKKYRVNLDSGHRLIAEACWKEFQAGSEKMTEYCLANLSAHLMNLGRWDDLLEFVTSPQAQVITRWIEEGEGDEGLVCLSSLIDYLDQNDREPVMSAGIATQAARIHSIRGEYDDAEKWLNHALARTSWRKGRRERAIALHELATLNLYRREFDQATRLYRKALRLCRWGIPIHRDEAAANLIGLATVCQVRYCFSQTIVYARAAIGQARSGGDIRHMIAGTRLVGHAYRSLGQYVEAESQLLAATQLCEQFDINLEKPRLRLHIGWIHYDLAALENAVPAQAKNHFGNALTEAKQVQDLFCTIEAELSLGWCAICEKATGEALNWFEPLSRRIPVGRHLEIRAGVELGLAAAFHQQGKLQCASKMYQEVIAFCVSHEIQMWRWKALVGFGAVCWHLGNKEEATRTWDEALQVAGEISQAKRELARTGIGNCQSNSSQPPR